MSRRPWRAGFSPWHSMVARGWDWHDPFPAWLTALRSETRSGVYVFRHVRTKAVLYVGESHSGALYSTITRHFQKWHGPQAGTTYKRREVEVSVRFVAPSRAKAAQDALIRKLRPRDNVAENPEAAENLEAAPF